MPFDWLKLEDTCMLRKYSYQVPFMLLLCIWTAPVFAGQFNVTSPAFRDGEAIPRKYTCDGKDISPAIQFASIPAGTKSLALISDDPDAPGGTWVHWVLFNLPADTTTIEANIPAKADLSNGAKHGRNSWGKAAYGGPCPPDGTHRYFFKVYALDIMLPLKKGAFIRNLEKAMKGHILAMGQIMGTYSR
jgi:Raf kinase inhibitor-like YbhB/YbcL family protein